MTVGSNLFWTDQCPGESTTNSSAWNCKYSPDGPCTSNVASVSVCKASPGTDQINCQAPPTPLHPLKVPLKLDFHPLHFPNIALKRHEWNFWFLDLRPRFPVPFCVASQLWAHLTDATLGFVHVGALCLYSRSVSVLVCFLKFWLSSLFLKEVRNSHSNKQIN